MPPILPDAGGGGEHHREQGIASGAATIYNDAAGIDARGQGTARGTFQTSPGGGMTTDKQPAAGVLETDKGRQFSPGGVAGAQQDGMINASRPAATSAVRPAMGVSPAAMHVGTYGRKDIQM